MPFPLTFLAGRTCLPDLPNPVLILDDLYSIAIMQSRVRKTKVLKRFYKPLITLPKERLPTLRCLLFAPNSCTLSY